MNFFSELRRRNVYRVVTAYIIVGWLIMQVVDVMAPALLLPEWIASLFAVLLLIGFPIAVVLSWIYDVTPDGLVRTDVADVQTHGSRTRRLDVLIVVGLVAVAGLVIWQQLDRRGVPGTDDYAADSIAVLPFDDLSAAGDQQYFADGIAEEILNELAGAGPLQVAGRTSSFSFRGGDLTLTDIGERLGVATLLEGSVRKQGERVRIAARLVRADDGIMLWTDTFDVRLTDIFAVQDEIARRVLDQLTTRIETPANAVPATPQAPFDAYDSFLRARELVATRELQSLEDARRLLDVAVALDPDYAPPVALLALTERLLTMAPGGVGRTPIDTGLPRAIGFAERAVALDPALADAHAVRGLLYMDENKLLLGEASFRRAVDINPSHENARLWLALCLAGKQQHRGAAEQMAKLFETNPLFSPVASNFVGMLTTIGDDAAARKVIERLERLEAPDLLMATARAALDNATGDLADTIKTLQSSYEQESSTSIAAGLAIARLRIGDGEGAQRYGLPFAPIRANLLAGKHEEAVAFAANLLERGDNYFVFQIEYINALAAAREDQQLIAFYKANFDDPAMFARELTWPLSFYAELQPFAAVAAALHRSGEHDELLPALMRQWRQTIDVGRANGAADMGHDVNDAFWHALNGDDDQAMAFLESAAAPGRGLIGVPLYDDYLHELLADHPRHAALMNKNLQRINEERAAIGLAAIVL